MENDIESDRDGIVKKIAVTKGDSVYEGDTHLYYQFKRTLYEFKTY